ncbi:Oidioi.mRNA.OKI2018_I69.XSR.g15710.t1.cds [Oikopleura dioica]|uniref:Oidioi.mRNA.OKI2018_I69.XSR.g15710.t1.cds n=1 Tax=Oikopleura dioica TaxID=34765 RepID=A0ABN7SDQ1_OIKDI|nr:Oidioi.mRNA.OKI2018_I69.XSR.g15710.t1.cds [Oikopleura dioica]
MISEEIFYPGWTELDWEILREEGRVSCFNCTCADLPDAFSRLQYVEPVSWYLLLLRELPDCPTDAFKSECTARTYATTPLRDHIYSRICDGGFNSNVIDGCENDFCNTLSASKFENLSLDFYYYSMDFIPFNDLQDCIFDSSVTKEFNAFQQCLTTEAKTTVIGLVLQRLETRGSVSRQESAIGREETLNRDVNIQETGPVKVAQPCETTPKENVEEMTWEANDAGSLALADQLKKIEVMDESDEKWCKDHVEQVYGYLRFLEHSKEVRPNFLAHHGQSASPKMRLILIDWMVQVARRFRLLNDTLFLTVAYMDRYLQRTETVEKSKMQLIGIACMMLASKNEEIYSPSLSDFVYVCDRAYSTDDIKDMELEVLGRLDCDLSVAYSLEFLRRFARVVEDTIDPKEYTMSKYLCELALMDYDLASMKPSLVAAGALWLSIKLISEGEWLPILEHTSTYSGADLENVTNLLAKCLFMAHFGAHSKKYTATKQKFAAATNFSISKLPIITEKEGLLMELAKKGKKFAEGRR